ncbi:MAG: hypothetical protein J7K68_02005 [Candidatus Diapherotrites archaeon]|nr:hypothetical protein [Candidatus Diapherotrites archaeon]
MQAYEPIKQKQIQLWSNVLSNLEKENLIRIEKNVHLTQKGKDYYKDIIKKRRKIREERFA